MYLITVLNFSEQTERDPGSLAELTLLSVLSQLITYIFRGAVFL